MSLDSGYVMKPNFNIGARNGLLEQKHFNALGNALWLYLWFLDKQPKNTDKVLGGRPITYQMFSEKFEGVPRITYVRWLSAIKKGGYINLVRTPRGVVVTINKPKKWIVSDVPKMIHHTVDKSNSDVSKMDSDVSKMIHAKDVSKMDIQYKRDSYNTKRDRSADFYLKQKEQIAMNRKSNGYNSFATAGELLKHKNLKKPKWNYVALP